MLTAEAIRNYELRKSPMGGYRVEEVEELREEMALTVERLTAQNEESLQKINVLAQKIEEYRRDEASIHEALLKAQKLGDRVLREARDQADKLMAETEKKASEIINSAQFKADATVSEAEAVAAELSERTKNEAETLMAETRKEAEETLAAAKAEAERILAEAEDKSRRMNEAAEKAVEKQQMLFDHIRGEVATFRAKLLEMYDTHLDLIAQIPDAVVSTPASLAEIIAEQPVPPPAYPPAPAEPEPQAAEVEPEPQAPAEPEADETPVETPAEPEPVMGGFRIMVDEDDEDDDRTATLTFGDEETTQGFVFKK